MHFRAIWFIKPYVEELLQRLNSGEIPADIGKELGPVDALDIAVSGLDEFMDF